MKPLFTVLYISQGDLISGTHSFPICREQLLSFVGWDTLAAESHDVTGQEESLTNSWEPELLY